MKRTSRECEDIYQIIYLIMGQYKNIQKNSLKKKKQNQPDGQEDPNRHVSKESI